ncbi:MULTISPECIES: tyrosine-type recombinase/integrase [Methylorubrum]|uniref:tyrosine-type recombinase/integrase n=1 Tax=Methylorubrum TaxID=2282523 RepID=UPI00345FF6A9
MAVAAIPRRQLDEIGCQGGLVVSAPRRLAQPLFHTWTEEEVARFEAHWPVGTRERLALDILLYTGLRRGDAARLGRPHVRNGVVRILTEKTSQEVTIRILPPLAASIAASPTGDLTFIAGERGRPMTKESFGKWFRDACVAAGAPGQAHGLRKAGARRAAESGAAEAELNAWFGWADGSRESATYVRGANRANLAERIAGRWNEDAITAHSDPMWGSELKVQHSQDLRRLLAPRAGLEPATKRLTVGVMPLISLDDVTAGEGFRSDETCPAVTHCLASLRRAG